MIVFLTVLSFVHGLLYTSIFRKVKTVSFSRSSSAESSHNTGNVVHHKSLILEASVMLLTFVKIIGTNYTNRTHVNYWSETG